MNPDPTRSTAALTRDDWLDGAVAQALGRLDRLRVAATGFPTSTRSGRWQFSTDGTWTAGFWPGRLWIAHLLTGETRFAEAARTWCARLAPRQLDRTTHDLGMMFTASFVQGWHITGDDAFRYGALAAASTLVDRYNARGRFIRAIGAPDDREAAGRTIVDTLMNLSLLFWATHETGVERYRDVAWAHAGTSRRHHVRPDGSTRQVYDFDPDTGAPLGPGHHQGHSVDTCWSRGQAWAMYGMSDVARWTGDPGALSAARSLADWWLAHATPDGVPAWDFAFNDVKTEPKDSSAVAIAAGALIELAAFTGEPAYRDAGIGVARSLAQGYTGSDADEEGILLHGTGVRPTGRDVDVSLSYGDHFYLELLLRLARPDEFDRSTATRSHR